MNTEPSERSYQLADYEFVLEAAERSQAKVILVGGQAVYGWAVQYKDRCPELNKYLPYTSKDADYLADVASALELAHALNRQFQPAPQKGGMRGLCPGRITLEGEKQVEILGQVNGVRKTDVEESAVFFSYHGKAVKVIHPILLLVAKGHNVAELDQTRRQDGKHFAIMQLERILIESAWAKRGSGRPSVDASERRPYLGETNRCGYRETWI